jgi:hypothetical protein
MKEKECLQAFLFFCPKIWNTAGLKNSGRECPFQRISLSLLRSLIPLLYRTDIFRLRISTHHIFQNIQRAHIAETFNMHGIIFQKLV